MPSDDDLEEGWLVKKMEPEKRDPHILTLEQQQWYDWTCLTGRGDCRMATLENYCQIVRELLAEHATNIWA